MLFLMGFVVVQSRVEDCHQSLVLPVLLFLICSNLELIAQLPEELRVFVLLVTIVMLSDQLFTVLLLKREHVLLDLLDHVLDPLPTHWQHRGVFGVQACLELTQFALQIRSIFTAVTDIGLLNLIVRDVVFDVVLLTNVFGWVSLCDLSTFLMTDGFYRVRLVQ
jgi:hypothetical protein